MKFEGEGKEEEEEDGKMQGNLQREGIFGKTEVLKVQRLHCKRMDGWRDGRMAGWQDGGVRDGRRALHKVTFPLLYI